MKQITESVVEGTELDWLKGLGYEVLSGLAIAPGEPAAERPDYKQVLLFDRLQTRLLSGELRVPATKMVANAWGKYVQTLSPRNCPADYPLLSTRGGRQ